MTPESEHTLLWFIQTIFVGTLIVMLGGAFGDEFLFIDFGHEAESLQRIGVALLFATGSVFFLFWNVSQLIDAKIDSFRSELGPPAEVGESIE